MSDWRLLKSESLTLNKADALEFARAHSNLPHSPVERDLDLRRVKKLEFIIRNGLALPFNWARVKFDGKVFRMNGQHSSAAIVAVGADIPDKLAFHMDDFEATDRNGVIELFRQYDQRWSSRTSADMAGAFQGFNPDLVACNKKILKIAAEGLSWCLRNPQGADAPTGDEIYSLYHDKRYTPFFIWIGGIINARKELMKKEVMAAMYATYDVRESGATKFWREVSFGPDYFTDDQAPGAVLIGELSRALDEREFRTKEFETPAHYYKKCLKAWKLFCAGQRTSTLKVAKGKEWPDVARFGDQEEAA